MPVGNRILLRIGRLSPWLVLLGVVGLTTYRAATALDADRPARSPIVIRTMSPDGTSRIELERTIASTRSRLDVEPGDDVAAVRLASALLRQARVVGNPGLVDEARRRLDAILDRQPTNRSVERMLVAVRLSRHEFSRAASMARSLAERDPADAWVRGVLGDALIELGRYDEAFDAYQEMMNLKPNAAAYARAAHGRQLQGDLRGALKLLRMATESTAANDAESLAWHCSQVGDLLLQLGELDQAREAYDRALRWFPGHPLAVEGVVRVLSASGQYERALAIGKAEFEHAPRAALAAYLGDLLEAVGQPIEAERHYRMAESAWLLETPEPTALVTFWAARSRRIADAVALGEATSAERRDIFTNDALAWAYFKAGRLDDARRHSLLARRTGSTDR